MINVFIQARMSSSRLPGKVLAPILNQPLIKHLLDNLSLYVARENIVVITSEESSDDPLSAYVETLNYSVFRGSLNNVFQRFVDAIHAKPCDYFVRLCADSPFIDGNLVKYVMDKAALKRYDVLSNVCSRKFPKGQSVECMRSILFSQIDSNRLSLEEKEHVFPYVYKNKHLYKCFFIECLNNLSHINQCVDTLEDIRNCDKNKHAYVFNPKDILIQEC